MKQCILFACFCCLSLVQTQAQSSTVSIDDRLYKVFEEDYLSRLLQERPVLIQRWNFYLDHAYYLTNNEKLLLEELPVITVKDMDTINILALMREQHILAHPQQEKRYRIAGEDWVLVLRSSQRLIKELNEHLGRKHPNP